MRKNTILKVENLRTLYKVEKGTVKAVNNVTLQIRSDEVVGVVGESGCGKSTLAKSILRVLPKNGRISNGKILLNDRNLLSLNTRDIRKVRWKEISIVTQSAMNSLDPAYKVGAQISEAIRAHSSTTKEEARERAKNLLEMVGIEARIVDSYPHELSGGMKQRSIIAMALALEPKLVIMDEPTTGLDVLIQDRIIQRLSELKGRTECSFFLITHDISVVSEMSDRIGVMYGGKLVEVGTTAQIFTQPYHPYTMGLENAFPHLKRYGKELISIPGSPPDLTGRIRGCIFSSRCPFSREQCFSEEPSLEEVGKLHDVACRRKDHVDSFRNRATEKSTWK